MIGIYKFTNKYNQKVYIGQSTDINHRKSQHIVNANNGYDSYFYNALRKYGKDAFYFDILIECPKENLDYWEKFYIKYYCSNNRDFGYNETSGGVGTHDLTAWNKGKHLTEEHKKHLKESKRKYFENNSIWNKGIKLTDEQRQKLSKPHDFSNTDLSNYHKGWHWKYDKELNKRIWYK